MSNILKKDLLKLVKKYNNQYRIQQYYLEKDRQSKEQIIDQLRKKNYKIVRRGTKWELHPIKDPKRFPKIS